MLSGLRVLDLSDSNAYTCGRFFASLGAVVMQVEAPGGDPLRHSPAPPALINNSDEAYWQSQNIGKKSITLNLELDTGIALCRDLIQKVDFLIESFTPGYLQQRQLDYDSVKQLNSRLIYISITPFGQSGPYSRFKGGELIASAMGGTLDTCGYTDEVPVLEALDACVYHANATAAMGAMLAYRERGLSGKGQHVDCSIQEVAASRNTNNLIAYQFDRRKLVRAGNCVRFGTATVRVIWKLKDGYCFHSMMTGKFGAPANSALSRWMDDEGFDNPMADVDWQSYDRSALAADSRAQWEAAMAAFFASLTKDQIRTEGAKRGIRATVANSPDDVLNDPHLNSRGFLQNLAQDSARRHPSYFIKSSATDTRIPAVISSCGEHNQSIYRDLLGFSQRQIEKLHQNGVI
jgi:crotonobetainyl-CoA:carnitine CoA-transferase CaiB-like acyl-CoA transferase